MMSAALLLFAVQAVRIPDGVYTPPFPVSAEDKPVHVAAFRLDREPVTNGEMLAFVTQHPQWRRDRVKPLFADRTYLGRWAGPLTLGPRAPRNAPVVDVSWFAARAICEARGGRLPTEAEWELAAAGGDDDIAWYESPAPDVLPAAHGAPNKYGVSDLHGLVWEWLEDFNAMITDTKACAAGAGSAADPGAYTVFMRYAFRSSLEGRYTAGSLGFRCAYDEAAAP